MCGIDVLRGALVLVEPIVNPESVRRGEIIVAVDRKSVASRKTFGDDENENAEEREVEDRHDLLSPHVREQRHEDRADDALRRRPIGQDDRAPQCAPLSWTELLAESPIDERVHRWHQRRQTREREKDRVAAASAEQPLRHGVRNQAVGAGDGDGNAEEQDEEERKGEDDAAETE